MSDHSHPSGAAAPETPAGAPGVSSRVPTALGRMASFRTTYLAVFLFAVAYVFSIEGLERVLQDHFHQAVTAATRLQGGGEVRTAGPETAEQVRQAVGEVVTRSPWVRFGDAQVRAVVLSADGKLLYASGGALDSSRSGPEGSFLLPATTDVTVTVPHNALVSNAVLVSYGAILLCILYALSRRADQQAEDRLEEVVRARDALVDRSRSIEEEIEGLRQRLGQIEPEKEVYAEEIHGLEEERTRLLARLAEVEEREEALRAHSGQARNLEEERRSLEELLEEAARELAEKDEEIRRLAHEKRRPPRGAGRAAREEEQLARRLRTLYKNLEIDDTAIANLARLGDESQKLRAEQALKRLSDEPDTAAVRRKVGGLPPHLSIFELGFAGSGRIYYTKGSSRRFRVLRVGAKNTQKTDLESLSRLPRET